MWVSVVPRRMAWATLALLCAVACSGEEGGSDGEAGASGAPATSGAAGAAIGGNAAGGSASAGMPGSSSAGRTNAGAGGATGGKGGGGTSGANAAGAAGNSTASGGAAGEGGGSTGAAGSESAGGAGSGGALGGAGAAPGGAGGTGGGEPPSILVFSRTTEYRHDAIPAGVAALGELASERAWTLTATEEASLFTDDGLAPFDVIVFLSTSGDMLDEAQQAAFERHIRAGHGFVGIHSASAGEYDWPFYGELVGAFFREHPDVQPATIHVEDPEHSSTAHLPERWTRTDEWYAFRTNPRSSVNVLLTLDETSYDAGTSTMDGDHPIAWYHEYEGARSFYTALGHTLESYSEEPFLQHLAGGIEWVLGR